MKEFVVQTSYGSFNVKAKTFEYDQDSDDLLFCVDEEIVGTVAVPHLISVVEKDSIVER